MPRPDRRPDAPSAPPRRARPTAAVTLAAAPLLAVAGPAAATATIAAPGSPGPAPSATITTASAIAGGPFSALRSAAADPAERLEQLASEHPGLVRLHRPLDGDDGLVIAELGPGDESRRAGRPAILILAGLDGRHRVGSSAALAIAEDLVADPEVLETVTVYVLPRIVEPGLRSGRAPVPDDADHDGRLDEDGGEDLDGDGVVRTMRIADPSPLLGLEATHVVDPDDPRIVRPAADDEVPTHAIATEGRDDDGDGRIAEDGPGGTHADRDWPAHWPEFGDGTGAWALSLPRTRAVADWMLEHEHVAMTLVFGPHDSLATVPTTRGAGPTGRVPEGLLAADEDVHAAVAEEFRSITGIAAGERGPRGPGSFDAWSYAHLGLWSFSSPLWHEPGRMGELARGRDDAGPDADDGGEGGGEEARTPSGSGPDAWLAWIDAERDGEGFAEWTAFDHPQLGRVEIGGLHPDLALQPPADLVPGIAAKATEFTRALLGMMPRLEIAGVHHRPMGGDLHEIAVTVRNAGEMPTRPAIAARARRLTPTLVRLDVDAERLIAGPRLARIERLEAGASESIRWTVRLDEPESVRVIVTDPVHGRLSASLGDREED